MSTTLAATLTAAIAGTFKKDVDFNDLQAVQNLGLTVATAYANGTGANQANQVWTDERTLADAASETLDLAGSLVDEFGGTVTFTAIKAFLIQNESADAFLLFEPGDTNGFTGPFADASDQLKIPPGGCLLLTNPTAAGWAVTAGTGDIIKLSHDGTGSNTLTYKIAIIGID